MQGDQADNQIDAFNAETKRMETQIKAQQANATIDKTAAQAMGEQLNNQQKMTEIADRQRAEAERMRAEAQRRAMMYMSDSEIARMQNGGI
jgi:hypothetical protein